MSRGIAPACYFGPTFRPLCVIEMKLQILNLERCIGCDMCVYACARTNYGSLSIDRSAIHVKTYGGIEGQFIVIACKGCDDAPCARVCPTAALEPRDGGGVKLHRERCVSCALCAEACIIGAIEMDPRTGRPLICIHCGACTRVCPHDVIGMVSSTPTATTDADAAGGGDTGTEVENEPDRAMRGVE